MSYINIRKACEFDIDNIEALYNESINWLNTQGINQWKKDIYPTKRSAVEAFQRGGLFCCFSNETMIGTFIIDENQPSQYSSLNWKYQSSNVLVLHTLVIKPGCTGQGYGKSIMEFVINFTVNNNYESIRLDVFPANKTAVALYNKFGFEFAGRVFFDIKDPGYEWYDCYEKLITDIDKQRNIEAN